MSGLSASKHAQLRKLVLAKNQEAVTKFKEVLNADMALLRAAQMSRSPAVPKLEYDWWGLYRPPNGVWQTLRQGGALSLMPHDELKSYTYAYEGTSAFMDAAKALAAQMDVTGAIAHRSANGNLLPTDIQELITATSECQGKLAFVTRLLQIEELGLDKAPRPVVDTP